MNSRLLFLDGFTESIASFSKYRRQLSDVEDGKYKKMILSLKNILDGELTSRQRECIWLYYGETMKMKDIAQHLGIGISSVSRHIKKARIRVEKTMKYYF